MMMMMMMMIVLSSLSIVQLKLDKDDLQQELMHICREQHNTITGRPATTAWDPAALARP